MVAKANSARAKPLRGPIPVPHESEAVELQVFGVTREMRDALDRLVATGMFGATRPQVVGGLLRDALRRERRWWDEPEKKPQRRRAR